MPRCISSMSGTSRFGTRSSAASRPRSAATASTPGSSRPSLLADDGTRVSVRVPNLLFTEWLPKHYSVVLAEALKDVGRANTELVFVPEDGQGRRRRPPDPRRQRCAARRSIGRSGPADAVARRASTPATPSTPSSSDRRISLRTRPAARSPKRRRARTTRCSSTAVSVSARRT